MVCDTEEGIWDLILDPGKPDGAFLVNFPDHQILRKRHKSDPGVYNMEPSPTEWLPQLEENIKNNVDGKIDAVAGATSSSSNAQQLLDAIYKNGKAGETITVSITPAK